MLFPRGIFGLLLFVAYPTLAMPQVHSVPSDRAELKGGDWFPYVFSKISPLEWWSFAVSPGDLKQVQYPDEFSFRIAQQNTWEFPRFCFGLFRPAPEALFRLHEVMDEYKGAVFWYAHDNCVGASPAKPTFYAPLTDANGSGGEEKRLLQMPQSPAKTPPGRDSAFVAKAMEDLPKFCRWIEDRLGLRDRKPQQFNSQWLTREGLASSRGPYEEFFEPGSWAVVLSPHPEAVASRHGEDADEDYPVLMGIAMSENDALLKELGFDWQAYEARGGAGPPLPNFPLLSRLGDITADTIYQPDEVDGLMAEYVRAENLVKDQHAIRGLDLLIRIARLAQKMKKGIYFGGQ
jgi:hypothetical protein